MCKIKLQIQSQEELRMKGSPQRLWGAASLRFCTKAYWRPEQCLAATVLQDSFLHLPQSLPASVDLWNATMSLIYSKTILYLGEYTIIGPYLRMWMPNALIASSRQAASFAGLRSMSSTIMNKMMWWERRGGPAYFWWASLPSLRAWAPPATAQSWAGGRGDLLLWSLWGCQEAHSSACEPAHCKSSTRMATCMFLADSRLSNCKSLLAWRGWQWDSQYCSKSNGLVFDTKHSGIWRQWARMSRKLYSLDSQRSWHWRIWSIFGWNAWSITDHLMPQIETSITSSHSLVFDLYRQKASALRWDIQDNSI